MSGMKQKRDEELELSIEEITSVNDQDYDDDDIKINNEIDEIDEEYDNVKNTIKEKNINQVDADIVSRYIRNRRNFHNLQRCNHWPNLKNIILRIIDLFPIDMQTQNEEGDYPLHTACGYGHHDVIMKLIQVFPEAVQHKNLKGEYPLYLAICNPYCPSEDVAMKLIEMFPEPVYESSERPFGTALHLACSKRLSETVIKKLIDINPLAIQGSSSYGQYPIYYAIWRDLPIAVIKMLLDGDPLGIERGSGNYENESQFHNVCIVGNVNVVEYYMHHSNLQINARDKKGLTPLHYACNHLKDNVVDMLLHSPDTDVNATDNSYNTSLHIAVYQIGIPERCFDVVEKLLNHHFILIHLKNKDGLTPMDLLKARIYQIENNDNALLPSKDSEKGKSQLQRIFKMIHILEAFMIQRKWQSYCYHVKNF